MVILTAVFVLGCIRANKKMFFSEECLHLLATSPHCSLEREQAFSITSDDVKSLQKSAMYMLQHSFFLLPIF